MKYTKDLIVLVLVMGIMGILGLIVVDEFMMANDHGGELDENVIGLRRRLHWWKVEWQLIFTSVKK